MASTLVHQITVTLTGPLLVCLGGRLVILVDEIASDSIHAASFLLKWVADFSFVEVVLVFAYFELLKAMSKLTLMPVGAETLVNEVLAERSFKFGVGLSSRIL